MTKYIDAEKLKKSISNYAEGAHAALNPIDGDYYKGKIDTCKDIQEFITSLQQDLPEVDLDEEMDRFFEEMPVLEHENIFEETYHMIARHFAEWGAKNAK